MNAYMVLENEVGKLPAYRGQGIPKAIVDGKLGFTSSQHSILPKILIS
jgi:hypothetical protein